MREEAYLGLDFTFCFSLEHSLLLATSEFINPLRAGFNPAPFPAWTLPGLCAIRTLQRKFMSGLEDVVVTRHWLSEPRLSRASLLPLATTELSSQCWGGPWVDLTAACCGLAGAESEVGTLEWDAGAYELTAVGCTDVFAAFLALVLKESPTGCFFSAPAWSTDPPAALLCLWASRSALHGSLRPSALLTWRIVALMSDSCVGVAVLVHLLAEAGSDEECELSLPSWEDLEKLMAPFGERSLLVMSLARLHCLLAWTRLLRAGHVMCIGKSLLDLVGFCGPLTHLSVLDVSVMTLLQWLVTEKFSLGLIWWLDGMNWGQPWGCFLVWPAAPIKETLFSLFLTTAFLGPSVRVSCLCCILFTCLDVSGFTTLVTMLLFPGACSSPVHFWPAGRLRFFFFFFFALFLCR